MKLTSLVLGLLKATSAVSETNYRYSDVFEVTQFDTKSSGPNSTYLILF